MNNKHLTLIYTIFILLLPLPAHAAIITGGLSYDSTSNLIHGSNLKTYLAADVLADLTYSETVAATAAGGAYEEYSIAGVSEAFEFYRLATGASDTNQIGVTQTIHSRLTGYENGDFGDDSNSTYDHFWFRGETLEVGLLLFGDNALVTNNNAGIQDDTSTIINSDRFSLTGDLNYRAISWLVYKDAQTSAVPVPAAVWLMGSGLLGLLSFGRKNKAQVVAA